jgi:ATP-binding cassette subfamily F protein uup
MLSGGERNRLLLAKLFSKPSNILVLDEPTNDLDIETLELLEELVMEYAGTVLVVSHDREFVNNVVSSTLVFEGDAQVNEYVGGYDDWLKYSEEIAKDSKREEIKTSAVVEKQLSNNDTNEHKEKKLSYKDQRELDALPAQIEKFEEEVEGLQQQMADSDFYKKGQDEVKKIQQQLADAQEKLSFCYTRWEELE